MATRSQLLELARLMERDDGVDAVEAGSHEWRIIIDALRVAAEAQTVG